VVGDVLDDPDRFAGSRVDPVDGLGDVVVGLGLHRHRVVGGHLVMSTDGERHP
jgi:hypothetical protein